MWIWYPPLPKLLEHSFVLLWRRQPLTFVAIEVTITHLHELAKNSAVGKHLDLFRVIATIIASPAFHQGVSRRYHALDTVLFSNDLVVKNVVHTER